MLLQASEQAREVLSPKIICLDMLLVANSIANSLSPLNFVMGDISNEKEGTVFSLDFSKPTYYS